MSSPKSRAWDLVPAIGGSGRDGGCCCDVVDGRSHSVFANSAEKNGQLQPGLQLVGFSVQVSLKEGQGLGRYRSLLCQRAEARVPYRRLQKVLQYKPLQRYNPLSTHRRGVLSCPTSSLTWLLGCGPGLTSLGLV